MFEWTDELKAEAIKRYEDAEPTAENTADIVNEIAEEIGNGCTPNGVRMILVRADKYVKKTPSSTKASSTSSEGSKRVSKADAQDALKSAISAKGLEPDEEIISKLTGKAAQYFAGIIA